MRLEGKVAVITGAGSGIGRGMARLFACEGVQVVTAERNVETLGDVVAEVSAAGGSVAGAHQNVAVEADCAAIVDAAMQSYGPLDIRSNDAGVMDTTQGVAEPSNEMWEPVIGIHPHGSMYLSRRTVPIMIGQGGGSIVNVASPAGKPALIVWGMRDIAFREWELKRWESMFPEARSVRLSSVGHFVQEEAPDELAEAVGSFLEETAPA